MFSSGLRLGIPLVFSSGGQLAPRWGQRAPSWGQRAPRRFLSPFVPTSQLSARRVSITDVPAEGRHDFPEADQPPLALSGRTRID